LIQCTSDNTYSSCNTVKNVANGYYINEGFEKASYPIISCVNTGCSVAAKVDTCSNNVGKVIQSESSLQLCISSTDSEAITIKKDGSEKTKKSFRLETIGYFPGSVRKPISVDINGDGSATLDLDTDGQLPICGNCETDKYCIKVNNDDYVQTIQTGSNTCSNISGTSSGEQILYFDVDNKKVETPDGTVKKAYKCTFDTEDGNSLKKCEVIDEKSIVIEKLGVMTCSSLTGCSLDKPENDQQSKYYILDEKEIGQLITGEGKSGYLYVCTNNSNDITCSLVMDVGYYINDGKDLYTCTKNGELKCVKNVEESIGTECKNDNIGEVVYIGEKYVLCVGNEQSKDLTNDTVEYIFSNDGAVSTYSLASNTYGFIKASSISVILNKEITGKKNIYILLY